VRALEKETHVQQLFDEDGNNIGQAITTGKKTVYWIDGKKVRTEYQK
jgi:hypothetical protein